ncbi:acyl carrier protein [Sphingomonas parva]|uniref:Acyl carrier protein n=1 Tax=Sphingomonas parva TaxID=2555898 RepID=A0A4Y8ZY86_9SPHN|nr:acyl carrier protein [Sphingomonas parva]TFI59889.1 acyl carrier protein [Sphingomonas parva]
MDEFLAEMAEILEEDTVNPRDELTSFESWDSLATLSVVAMADDKFGVNMSAQELQRAVTVEDLYQLITAKKAA